MYSLIQITSLYKQTIISSFHGTEVFVDSNPDVLTIKDIEDKTGSLRVNIEKVHSELIILRESLKLKEKADDILEKVMKLKEFEKQVGGDIHTLEAGILLLEEKEKIESPSNPEQLLQNLAEISSLREKLFTHKRDYFTLIEESGALQRTLETLSANKLTQAEQETYKTITNTEFLALPANERLRFITVGNYSADMIASGDVKDLEFTFTYDGVFNRDFYTRTTAWQVLPDEVRELSSGGEVFIRNGLNGEFFTSTGKRLLIHEKTQIEVTKLAKPTELESIEQSFQPTLKKFPENSLEYTLAYESLKRGIDPNFVILLHKSILEKTSKESLKVTLEDLLTDIARYQDDFFEDHPNTPAFKDGKVTDAFAGYVFYLLQKDPQELIKQYGFDSEKLKTYKKTAKNKSGGAIDMEKVEIADYSKAQIENILKQKRFIPGSREAVILFTIACQSCGLPVEWAQSLKFHKILSSESQWKVWVLNYEIPKSYSTESFKAVSLQRRNNNPIGVKSTASGLGQMLLSNVDAYYPDGRQGIGDPLNEAVGMMRYIYDRYGSLDVAASVYGRITSYTHAVTGERRRKTFKEGY